MMTKEFVYGLTGLIVVVAIFLLVLFDYSGVI